MMNENDPLMDQDAAAKVLGLKNPKTLAIWRGRRQGPPWVHVGRLVRYKASDLAAFIAAGRVDPSQPTAVTGRQ